MSSSLPARKLRFSPDVKESLSTASQEGEKQRRPIPPSLSLTSPPRTPSSPFASLPLTPHRVETHTFGGWTVLREDDKVLYFCPATGDVTSERPACVPASALPLNDTALSYTPRTEATVTALVAACAARRALGWSGSPTRPGEPLASSTRAGGSTEVDGVEVEGGSSPDWRRDRRYRDREVWRLAARWRQLKQLQEMGVECGGKVEGKKGEGKGEVRRFAGRHELHDGDEVFAGRTVWERAANWMAGRGKELREEEVMEERRRKEEKVALEKERRVRAEERVKRRSRVMTNVSAAIRVQAVWRAKVVQRKLERGGRAELERLRRERELKIAEVRGKAGYGARGKVRAMEAERSRMLASGEAGIAKTKHRDPEGAALVLGRVARSVAAKKQQRVKQKKAWRESMRVPETTRLARLFRHLDTSGDGKLSAQEWVEATSNRLGLRRQATIASMKKEVEVKPPSTASSHDPYNPWAHYDAEDEDGEEALPSVADAMSVFKQIDRDKSASIDMDEFVRYFMNSPDAKSLQWMQKALIDLLEPEVWARSRDRKAIEARQAREAKRREEAQARAEASHIDLAARYFRSCGPDATLADAIANLRHGPRASHLTVTPVAHVRLFRAIQSALGDKPITPSSFGHAAASLHDAAFEEWLIHWGAENPRAGKETSDEGRGE